MSIIIVEKKLKRNNQDEIICRELLTELRMRIFGVDNFPENMSNNFDESGPRDPICDPLSQP